MSQTLRIDFVSDVACPWCAVGLNSLLKALEQLQGEVAASIHFRPFELAPDMPEEGERILPHLSRKYGISEAQVKQNQEQIRLRGAELGFVFDFQSDSMKWNTFSAHQLLHWAGELGEQYQLDLKQALLEAYFSHNRNPSEIDVLVELAEKAGLDPQEARLILQEQRYAEQVRAEEQEWLQLGVSSVPTIVFNQRYALSGGQPVEAFVSTIRNVLEETSLAGGN